MKIFVTGEPGVGKSTLLNKVITHNNHLSLKGCVVDAIIKNDKRSGFNIRYISPEGSFNKRTLLSSKEEHLSDFYISKYSVNLKGLEEEFIPFMKNIIETHPPDLIIFDEIGRMQNATPLFLSHLDLLLEKETPIIATVVLDDEKWARKYKTSDFQIKMMLENRTICFNIIQYLISHSSKYNALNDEEKRHILKKFNSLFEKKEYLAIYSLL
jgi:nucleoside-triphosphatase